MYTQTSLSLEDTALNPGVEERAYGWPYTETVIKRGDSTSNGPRGAYTIFLDENKPQEEQDFTNKTWKFATAIAREMIAKREGKTIANLTASDGHPEKFL